MQTSGRYPAPTHLLKSVRSPSVLSGGSRLSSMNERRIRVMKRDAESRFSFVPQVPIAQFMTPGNCSCKRGGSGIWFSESALFVMLQYMRLLHPICHTGDLQKNSLPKLVLLHVHKTHTYYRYMYVERSSIQQSEMKKNTCLVWVGKTFMGNSKEARKRCCRLLCKKSLVS